ncbi:MAG: hypothetical protein IKO89_08895 [Bacteroidales bacterium]|nr:hypothetical protein [Bacteroidales bacterium]MBR4488660.1 hypothetical protein [Bacteroidales bacterium]
MQIDGLLQNGWQRLQSLPKDPRESVSIGKITPNAQCFALLFPIDIHRAMPFDNIQVIIDGIHDALHDNQALIEVNRGCTEDGRKYIYSIVKTLQINLDSVQYFLRASLETNNGMIEVNAFFDEIGTTGIRDNTIYEAVRRKYPEKEIPWTFDPYDKLSQRHYLMNLSELEQYDHLFPEHPLSQARHLIHILCSPQTQISTKKIKTTIITDPFREPRQLVNDFINEHLNGNINKLIDYDFRQLKGIERYGDTEGYSFDIYRTQLVRAIATLVFKDIAPKEVMFHPKRGTLILAPSPLIAENLWGEQIEDKFVMFSVLRFCHNQKEWAPRIIPCAALCNSIGNLYLQPYPLADYRHSHTLGRFLSDHALNDLYNTLMDEKSGSPLMKKVVAEAKKFFEPYRGADGWQLLVERWLIEGLVDYYWNPEPFFNDFTLNADIPTDVYFKALNQCIEMCHEIIPKRAKRMVQKLKDDL